MMLMKLKEKALKGVKGQGIVEYAGAIVVAAVIIAAVIALAPGVLTGLFTAILTSIQNFLLASLPGAGG